MNDKIRTYKEMRVYQNAMDVAMTIFELTKRFPSDERYSLVDQIRRSSRSVCANLAEAWRKRVYKAAFLAKLSDAESEASETQVWIEFAHRCGYITSGEALSLDGQVDVISAQLVRIKETPEKWLLPPSPRHFVSPSP